MDTHAINELYRGWTDAQRGLSLSLWESEAWQMGWKLWQSQKMQRSRRSACERPSGRTVQ